MMETPPKRKKQISLMRGGNARAYINYLKDTGLPFTLAVSNYTIAVDSPVINKKFVASFQSKRTFAAFAKIKSDCKKKPTPEVRRDELVYFLHDFRRDVTVSQVINIDIRAAYATILFRDGYISEETYNYLKRCNKNERLASVGMLASKKNIFEFVGRNVISEETIVSPTAPFFYHAVKRTYSIMSELKRLVGNDYLFTWVDGIYFLPGNRDRFFDACAQLAYDGFEYTTAVLSDFNAELRSDRVCVTFHKDGKKKVFNLPFMNNQFKAIALDAILSINHKNKNNEALQNHYSRTRGR